MIDPFADRGSFVTVAVAFDRHSMPLVEAGAQIALRTGTRILCAEEVLDEAGLAVPAEQEDEVERFREFLDQVTPEDFEAH